MEDFWDPNALIVCPYDEVHVISVQRFQRHILKCRKNHPDKDTVTCPYNATHIILREKFKSHLGCCPDQKAIDADVIQAQNDETGEIERLMGKVSIPEDTWVSPHEGEDWDLEAAQHQEEIRISNDKSMSDSVPIRRETAKVQNHIKVIDKSKNREDVNHFQEHSFSEYVRMAGRGFSFLKDIKPMRKPGTGRGTCISKKP